MVMASKLTLKVAIKYLKLAADKGNSCAIYNVAVMLKKGEGCDGDLNEAFHMARLAIDKGSLSGMKQIKGEGCQKNSSEDFRLMKEAADEGNLEACLKVGNYLFQWNERGLQVLENRS
ncbi:hypothetical protein M9Y10_030838 [Tritrichomonas musculus]|uniref:Uncharacterized protein n=1 Tax=Tritrichomonas musculus TaxID=1915356 RepID=A0ABR2H248_9EUKA